MGKPTTYVFKSNLTLTATVICTPTQQVAIKKILPIVLTSKFSLTLNRTNQISVNLDDLQINWQPSTLYAITVNSGFVIDSTGQPNPIQRFDYISNAAPTFNPNGYSGTDPAPGDTATTNNSSITLYFGRFIYPKTGSFYLYELGTGGPTLLKTFNIQTDVQFINNINNIKNNMVLKLNVAGLLKSGTTYYLLADPNSLADYDNLNFPGITSTTAYRYTTAGEPYFKDLIVLESSSFNLICNGGKSQAAQSNLLVTSRLVGAIGSAKLFSANLQSRSSSIIIGSYLEQLVNVKNIAYIANKSNQLFTGSNIPRVDTSDDTFIYTVNFSVDNGLFGDSSGPISNFSLTGTAYSINNAMSQVYFWPTKNIVSNQIYSLALYRNGNLINSIIRTFTYSSSNPFQSYTFTANAGTGSYTPTTSEIYYALMDYIVVGAGGGGGGYNGGIPLNSGGGGGQVLIGSNITPSNITNITVAGQSYSDGDSSSITINGTTITAAGGGFPTPNLNWAQGTSTFQPSGPTIGYGGRSGQGGVSNGNARNTLQSGISTNGYTIGGNGCGQGSTLGDGYTWPGDGVTYSYGGPGGNPLSSATVTIYTTPGSGGYGGRNPVLTNSTPGQAGIVIIKLHA